MVGVKAMTDSLVPESDQGDVDVLEPPAEEAQVEVPAAPSSPTDPIADAEAKLAKSKSDQAALDQQIKALTGWISENKSYARTAQDQQKRLDAAKGLAGSDLDAAKAVVKEKAADIDAKVKTVDDAIKALDKDAGDAATAAATARQAQADAQTAIAAAQAALDAHKAAPKAVDADLKRIEDHVATAAKALAKNDFAGAYFAAKSASDGAAAVTVPSLADYSAEAAARAGALDAAKAAFAAAKTAADSASAKADDLAKQVAAKRATRTADIVKLLADAYPAGSMAAG